MERSTTAPLKKPRTEAPANGHLPQDKFVGEGLTYDDVLLVPAYSEVLPREVEVRSQFSRNIKLNVPIVSAAMDTVTGSQLAIAIAQQGGIGVIHKNQGHRLRHLVGAGPRRPLDYRRHRGKAAHDATGIRRCGRHSK